MEFDISTDLHRSFTRTELFYGSRSCKISVLVSIKWSMEFGQNIELKKDRNSSFFNETTSLKAYIQKYYPN